MKNTKKNRTNTLIIIVAIIFILSLGAAMIILLKNDDKKDDSQDKTSSTISSSTSTSTSSINESEPTSNKTTSSKTTKKTTDKKTTTKKPTTTKKQSSNNCNLEELERIAEANAPDKYAVWKAKPTFNVPPEIEYGIGHQKFFWMWYQVGTIDEGGVTKPDYIWVVASDKESGMGYPRGEGNSIHEIKPSGHFKNAMKYLIPKPTDSGTKEGERRGVISLYYYDGTTAIRCD